MTTTLRPPQATLAPNWQLRIGATVATVAIAVGAATNPLGRLIAIIAVFALAVKWPVRRLLASMLVLFVAVDDPASAPFNGLWESPVQHIGDFWFFTIGTSVPFLPIPVAPMLLVSLIVFARSVTGRTGPGMAVERASYERPVSFANSLVVALAVIPTMAAYGYVTGGNVQQVYYQVFGILIALSLAGAAAQLATREFAELLMRIIVVAAVYRAFLAIYVFVTVAKNLPEPPLYLTSHNDSLLWVVALVWVSSNLIERADRTSKQIAGALFPILSLAIVVNNRRLAWVIFFGAFAYVVLSASKAAHRRLRSVSAVAVPLLAVYFVAGLVAPPSRIFAPVQAVQSVFLGDDRSSQTRGIEDYNLLFTMRQTFPRPSGFGQPYIEAVVADDISAAFPQFQYLPHNSMLGMLMLVGPFALILLLTPLALGVQASHRLRRATQDPQLRTITAMIMSCWIGFLAHAWGDLGLFSPLPTAMIGLMSGLGIGLHGWYRTHGGLTEELQ